MDVQIPKIKELQDIKKLFLEELRSFDTKQRDVFKSFLEAQRQDQIKKIQDDLKR